MAVHAVCEFCEHKLSVPDRLKGKKVNCPNCGKRTRVITSLDLTVEEARRREETRPRQKEVEKEKKPPAKQQVPSAQVQARPAAPEDSVTRYPDLRTLRGVFTFFAYLIGVLAVAVGIILFLRAPESQHGLLLLLGLFVGGIVSFCVLKLLAGSARLGADLGDMEARMLELLLEIRDKLDRLKR